jgi:hypothetical protein
VRHRRRSPRPSPSSSPVAALMTRTCRSWTSIRTRVWAWVRPTPPVTACVRPVGLPRRLVPDQGTGACDVVRVDSGAGGRRDDQLVERCAGSAGSQPRPRLAGLLRLGLRARLPLRKGQRLRIVSSLAHPVSDRVCRLTLAPWVLSSRSGTGSMPAMPSPGSRTCAGESCGGHPVTVSVDGGSISGEPG